jgi:hypothetical protein
MTMRRFLLAGFFALACARDVGTPTPRQTDAPSQANNTAAPKDDAKVANASHAHEGGAHAGCVYNGADGTGVCGNEPDAPKQSTGHFGAPFAAATPVPLAKAIGASTTGTVLVSGTVEAVCQKKGCWMVVKDGTDSARVMMKDHAFAVPIDARGKAVLVEGELTSRTFTEAQAKHLEEDKGGDPNAVAGERKEHVLMATAVEIKS